METVIAGSKGMVGSGVIRHLTLRKVLLVCGVVSSLLYAVTDLFAGTLYVGYSFSSQGFSELWSIGSPVRQSLLPLVIAYNVVLLAFASGVWESAGRSRALRVTALMLVGDAIVGLVTPTFFPPPLRGAVGAGSAGIVHLILTGVNVLFIFLSIGFGAAAYRNWFRFYSIGTIVILLAFGVIAFSAAPAIGANQPTPWAGLEERILIYGYLLWVAVAAIVLLRVRVERHEDAAGGSQSDLGLVNQLSAYVRENIMTTIVTFVKAHPVLTYFALVFVISWGGLTVLVGGPAGISAERIAAPFFVLYLMTVAGPSTASVLLTGLLYGRSGFRELLSRLLNWRVGVRWYAVAILASALSLSITLFALSLTSPVFVPGIFASSDNASSLVFGFSTSQKATFLLFVLGLGLFNGFVEELGWTGFAIPKLTPRYGVILTGLGVGLLWGGWHGLSNYLGSAVDAGGLPLAFYVAVLLFSFLPPFRVLMVWVYDRTKSLLVAMLMHASLNFFWLAATPLALTAEQRVTWYIAWAVVLWVFVAITQAAWARKSAVESRSSAALPVR